MPTRLQRIQSLPVELQNKIFQYFSDIIENDNFGYKLEYFRNNLSRKKYVENTDKCIYTLFELYDIEDFGFTAQNISSLGLVGTLDLNIKNMQKNILNIRKYMKNYFVEINIMNNLLKRTRKAKSLVIDDNIMIDMCDNMNMNLQIKAKKNLNLLRGIRISIKTNIDTMQTKNEIE